MLRPYRKDERRKVAKNELLNTQDVARGQRKRWKAWSMNGIIG
jgi:hypothetical protein